MNSHSKWLVLIAILMALASCRQPKLPHEQHKTANADFDLQDVFRFSNAYCKTDGTSIGVYSLNEAKMRYEISQTIQDNLDSPIADFLSEAEVKEAELYTGVSKSPVLVVQVARSRMRSSLSPFVNGRVCLPIVDEHVLYFRSQPPQPRITLMVKLSDLSAFFEARRSSESKRGTSHE